MADIPRFDFHMHTKYLGCANETMEVPAIVKECERLGVTSLGITDHLNSLDRLPLHVPIKEDIEALETDIAVYFGVELNFLGLDAGFAFNAKIKEQYGFQFAIAGVHSSYVDAYDLKKIIEIQHRHHLKICRDPLVDVLAHPYCLMKHEFDRNGWPWIDSMQAVPESYMRELGQAAKETGTAIEINAESVFGNANFSNRFLAEYATFLSVLADEGACFSVGSDAHDIKHLKDIPMAWKAAEQLGLTPDRIWSPKCQPMKGAARAGEPDAPNY